MPRSAKQGVTGSFVALALVVLSGASCFVPTRHGVRVFAPVPPAPHIYVPPPVVVAPRPRAVYVAPAPVYVAPAAPPPAVVYAPAPSGDYAPPPQAQPAPPPAACIDPGNRDVSDRFDQATPIEPASQTVACTYRGDVDVFVVTAPPANAGVLIRYSLRGASQMAPIVEVFNAFRAPLNRQTGGVGAELHGWAHLAGGSPMYIRVTQYHGANEPYTLSLEYMPLADAAEPNGDFEHAAPVREGTSVQGYLSNAANDPTSLADWYRVDVAQGRDLLLDLDTPEGIAPKMELFNGNRRPLGARGGAAGERIQLAFRVPPGPYFIKISTPYSVPSAGQGDLPPWLVKPYTLYVR